MKEEIIKKYLSNIDWINGKWSQSIIREELRQLLGEKPALYIKYDKNVMLNEETGEAIEFNDLNYVEVTFTDLDTTTNGLQIRKYRQLIGV